MGEVGVLAPHGHCLIVVGDQAYHCYVIGKLDDGGGVTPGHAVMSEHGVQEGIEHAPLRNPCVEDQSGGSIVTYTYHLGAAVRKSRIQLCLVPGSLA